ncbi:MAG: adenine phosphoribosyltransferase [Candidatus Sumerlaeota bacterium]|nr:adenine phosphoribosyltransferase [Candidatus Sumerlaeota bacterium]
MIDLSSTIRNVPDFPKPGIQFKDITTLVKNPEAFRQAIDTLAKRYKGRGIQKIVGVESRGFIFGAALAYKLKLGFVPVRKPKKLPAATIREEYALEYGTDALEIHTDAIGAGERVLVLDDLLATGGTLAATCRLVERLGGVVEEVVTIIELTGLHGREKIKNYRYHALIDLEVHE